jgi:hypothetical protein
MNAVNGVNPNVLRVIAFHLGVQPNGEEITMSAFERLLAIADEETLDLARALVRMDLLRCYPETPQRKMDDAE